MVLILTLIQLNNKNMNKHEIEKLHKSIATDFKIVTRKTNFWDMDFCHCVLHDIKKMLLFGYVESVSLILSDSMGRPLKAKKYIMIISNHSIDNRPGTIDWDEDDGSGLNVVLTHTITYQNLSQEHKNTFQIDQLKSPWSPTGIDVSFPGLFNTIDKTYSHEGRGINRIDFN